YLVLDAMDRASALPREYGFTIVAGVFSTLTAVFAARVLYGVSVEVARARQLGSYRLEGKIGMGGMGEVWRARHRWLVRPAAIKLVRPELAKDEDYARIMRRFEREAQLTATLNSPHTIQLYDFGVTEDGDCYYVMELLDGVDLKTLVDKYGAVAAERAVYILQQVCDSLADAHHSDMIHRDIKPSNVFLCRKGLRHDYVKVLDFGMATLMPRGPVDNARTTMDGMVGTPAFMAPEIATGGGENTDHRVDIYALGCVAYWLLTGRVVFECKTAMATIAAHASQEPLRPSEVSEVDIGSDLEAVVMACLEKNPDDRPQDAKELSHRLGSLDLATPWTPARAERWWRNHCGSDNRADGAPYTADTGHEAHADTVELYISKRSQT
ncbi:MAG: serine/threonine protein kinase, partial [Proteobacteria bacterium]|nr:serine/threonine protein kinase [Pseudomonadota bacterium]